MSNHQGKFYNCFGKRLFTHIPKFIRRKWGKISRTKDGKHCYADPFCNIFRKPNTNVNGFARQGKYIYCKPFTLLKGTIIARYGTPFGSFATDFGVPYHMLGLPYIKETVEYHVYRVLKDIQVFKGVVAPIFNSPGGGVQYFFHKEKLNALIRDENEDDEFFDPDDYPLEEIFIFGH